MAPQNKSLNLSPSLIPRLILVSSFLLYVWYGIYYGAAGSLEQPHLYFGILFFLVLLLLWFWHVTHWFDLRERESFAILALPKRESKISNDGCREVHYGRVIERVVVTRTGGRIKFVWTFRANPNFASKGFYVVIEREDRAGNFGAVGMWPADDEWSTRIPYDQTHTFRFYVIKTYRAFPPVWRFVAESVFDLITIPIMVGSDVRDKKAEVIDRTALHTETASMLAAEAKVKEYALRAEKLFRAAGSEVRDSLLKEVKLAFDFLETEKICRNLILNSDYTDEEKAMLIKHMHFLIEEEKLRRLS